MKEIFYYLASGAAIISVFLMLLESRNNKNREIRARTEQIVNDFWNNIYPVYLDLFNSDLGQPYTRGIVTTSTLANNPNYIKILSYFEYLGALWNRKNVDKKIIQENIYGYVVISFNLFKRYIEDSRNDYGNPGYCSNWENMVDDLNRRALILRSRKLSNTNLFT
jgi:hypothetical protein